MAEWRTGPADPVVDPWDESLTWTGVGAATGTPAVSPPALTLATATAGASIYYSTDGSYPAPDTGTFYLAALTGLAAGTILRAVAYAADLNPSDLTELEITA